MPLKLSIFLNTYEKYYSFIKKMGFLKKNMHIFKIGKDGKFAVECLSNEFIS